MWYTLARYDSVLIVDEDEDEEYEESECGRTEEEKVYEADSEPEDEGSEESESEIDERLENEKVRMNKKTIEVPSKEVWSSEEEGIAPKSPSPNKFQRCVGTYIQTRSGKR